MAETVPIVGGSSSIETSGQLDGIDDDCARILYEIICRKFVFAPVCRGVTAKRSSGPPTDHLLHQANNRAEDQATAAAAGTGPLLNHLQDDNRIKLDARANYLLKMLLVSRPNSVLGFGKKRMPSDYRPPMARYIRRYMPGNMGVDSSLLGQQHKSFISKKVMYPHFFTRRFNDEGSLLDYSDGLDYNEPPTAEAAGL